VAGALAIFIVYTAFAGNGVAQVKPSTLAATAATSRSSAAVVGKVTGDAYGRGMRFQLKDIGSADAERVPVVYRGRRPDLFKTGRDMSSRESSATASSSRSRLR